MIAVDWRAGERTFSEYLFPKQKLSISQDAKICASTGLTVMGAFFGEICGGGVE